MDHIHQTSPPSLPPNVRTTPPERGRAGASSKIYAETLPIHNHFLGRAAIIPICICFRSCRLHSIEIKSSDFYCVQSFDGDDCTPSIPEPEQWHEGPKCHIYIAACDNIDHYRAKVHPAIWAFVNQIEGSAIGIKDDSTHGSDNGGAVSTPSTPMESAKKTTRKPTANEKALERTGLAAPVRRLLFCWGLFMIPELLDT